MSQLEDDLRNALRDAEVPDAVAARLRSIDYRPRPPWLGVAIAAGGVVGLVAIAATIVSIIGLDAGAQTAFAGWSASPTVPANGQTMAAEAACLARVPNASDAGRARNDGTVHAPVMEALLKIAPDEWRTVLADTRGSSTMIVLEATKDQAEASCLSDSSASDTVMSVGPVGEQSGPVAAGQVQVLSTGSQGATNGHTFSYIAGRVGTNVAGVTIVLQDGDHISSTVANGRFAAWWPGSQHAVSQEVTTYTVTNILSN